MVLLLLAARNNFTHTAMCLLKEEVWVNHVDRKGNTPLHYAVKHKNLTLIKALLNAGYDVNARKLYSDLPPLHIAVTVSENFQEFVEMFQAFLTQNCNLNYQCIGTMETALYRAINMDKTEIAELLLIAGADPNLSNPFGVSCLQKSMQRNNPRLTKVLLHCGLNKKKELSVMHKRNSVICEFNKILDLTDFFRKTQPSTLQECCRDVIRHSFTVNLCTGLRTLAIPKSIKKYILLSDISPYYKLLL